MRELVSQDRPVGEEDILSLHRFAVARTLDSAGHYATAPRMVTTSSGDKFFPEPDKVPGLMAAFVKALPDQADPERIFLAHLEFVSIR